VTAAGYLQWTMMEDEAGGSERPGCPGWLAIVSKMGWLAIAAGRTGPR
jgi:hypothetical protein